jgi:hypothetical protein
MFNKVGFVDAELVGETGFNSSPVTKGVLFRARKSAISDVRRYKETKAVNEEKSGQEGCST